MELYDGLQNFKNDDETWDLTEKNERLAQQITRLISQHRDRPDENALSSAEYFLLEVERWKAMCIPGRMGNVQKNSKRAIWNALLEAIRAESDLETLRAIMRLKGFGASIAEETGQRRAKAATSVLRFLMPADWGVVDWRTVAMISLLDKNKGNMDEALNEAKLESSRDLRSIFDIVDEHAACEINERYRSMRIAPHLTRAADVDMALFGLSLMAWPLSQ